MNLEHILKDCPEFHCYKCEEQEYFARYCRAVKCQDCHMILDKCWLRGDGEEEEEGQLHEETTETQMDEQLNREC